VDTLIIGIGQTLRGDDSAGLAAVQLWQDNYLAAWDPGVQVELAGLPGLALLEIISGHQEAVIVDAIRSHHLPGTVHRLTPDQLGSFETGSRSAHGWGVSETLALGRHLCSDDMPEHIIIIGIEAGQVRIGAELSDPVKSALPVAAEIIESTVSALRTHAVG
jgi:hydrogenase maturation protease